MSALLGPWPPAKNVSYSSSPRWNSSSTPASAYPLNRSTVSASASPRESGRRGQLGDRVGADPGAGLEVGGRVALGHRDRREPAVLAGVEDVPGRDPLRRLGHLAAEPVVGQALVGVAAAALVDHQPAAEAEGERAAAVGLLEPGAEPAERAGSRWPRPAPRRPRSARRCWCRAGPWSRRCRRGRRGRGASPRCPRSRRRPAARRAGRRSRPGPPVTSRPRRSPGPACRR